MESGLTVTSLGPQARVQWESLPWFVSTTTVLVPTLAGLLVGLVHQHLPPAQRSLGPPDVIEGVHFNQPLPSLRSGSVSAGIAARSLLAAMAVILFMRLLLAISPTLARWIKWLELHTAMAGLAVGLTALALPNVLGIGTSILRFAMIDGAFGMGEVIVLTGLCIGAGFSSGAPKTGDHHTPVSPSVSIFRDSPQCLQWIASGSCRFRPQFGHLYLILDGWKIARASCKNSATPTIMMKTDSSLPPGVVMVISPKPVVVSVATVK